MPNLPNLYRQKRLAMALFGAGQRKVWLDPSKKELIERAKSRADIRRLISDGVIVDKSVFEQKFAYKVAQVMRTDTSAAFDSFASRWRRNPLKARLPHMLPRVSRKR